VNVLDFPRPQPCHHCDQPYVGAICPICKEERPAYTALKRITAKAHHGVRRCAMPPLPLLPRFDLRLRRRGTCLRGLPPTKERIWTPYKRRKPADTRSSSRPAVFEARRPCRRRQAQPTNLMQALAIAAADPRMDVAKVKGSSRCTRK
jgi:hypothetical protein